VSVLCPCGRTARTGHECAVTRLRAELESAKSRLATATEVLREWDKWWCAIADAPLDATRAFLDNQPAAPTGTREAGE
jgi:hypothetical protein